MLFAQLQFVATIATETVKKAQQLKKALLQKLAARGNLCHRDNGVWTEMAQIPLAELLEIVKEQGEEVKIGPC